MPNLGTQVEDTHVNSYQTRLADSDLRNNRKRMRSSYRKASESKLFFKLPLQHISYHLFTRKRTVPACSFLLGGPTPIYSRMRFLEETLVLEQQQEVHGNSTQARILSKHVFHVPSHTAGFPLHLNNNNLFYFDRSS